MPLPPLPTALRKDPAPVSNRHKKRGTYNKTEKSTPTPPPLQRKATPPLEDEEDGVDDDNESIVVVKSSPARPRLSRKRARPSEEELKNEVEGHRRKRVKITEDDTDVGDNKQKNNKSK